VFVTAEPASPAAPSLTTQAFWLVTAKFLGFGCAFAVPLLLVRVLSLVEFGLYKQAFLVIATAQAILPLGVGLSAFYFLARERERQPAVVLNILLYHVVAAVAAAVALTAWPDVLRSVLGDAALIPYAPLVGLVILLWVPSSFLETVATAHQEVRLSTIFIVAAQITRGTVMIVATIWFGSIGALLYAAVLQGVVQSIILVWYLRSRFGRFWRDFDWPLLRTQMAYALPFGLAGLIYTLQTDLHQYLVAHVFGTAAFAIYAVGCFQLPVTGLLREAVGSVMVPRVTRLQQSDDRSEITRLIVRVMRKLSFIYLPLYAFLVVAGPVFIEALFTRRFAASWPIFLVNLTLLPLAIVVNDPVLRAYPEHRHFLLKLRLALLGILLMALPAGVVRFGMEGAIGAVVMTVAIERGISTWRVARILGVRAADLRPLIDVIRIAGAAALAALAAAWLRMGLVEYSAVSVLAACAGAYFIVYIGALIGLRVPNGDEAKLAQRQWARVRRRLPFATQPS
jgi:O-antigen/teichoic acid export membrane protein